MCSGCSISAGSNTSSACFQTNPCQVCEVSSSRETFPPSASLLSANRPCEHTRSSRARYLNRPLGTASSTGAAEAAPAFEPAFEPASSARIERCAPRASTTQDASQTRATQALHANRGERFTNRSCDKNCINTKPDTRSPGENTLATTPRFVHPGTGIERPAAGRSNSELAVDYVALDGSGNWEACHSRPVVVLEKHGQHGWPGQLVAGSLCDKKPRLPRPRITNTHE